MSCYISNVFYYLFAFIFLMLIYSSQVFVIQLGTELSYSMQSATELSNLQSDPGPLLNCDVIKWYPNLYTARNYIPIVFACFLCFGHSCVLLHITLVLVCCVCFLTLAGKTIIVYTASLFAQKRKVLTTFASSAITTVLCSADQTLNGLAEVCCLSLLCILL